MSNDAAGFALCYGPLICFPHRGFRRWASTRSVSRPSRQPATGPPGSYPDRTFTGKRRRAYEHDDPPLRHGNPPVLLGARDHLTALEEDGYTTALGGHASASTSYPIDRSQGRRIARRHPLDHSAAEIAQQQYDARREDLP